VIFAQAPGSVTVVNYAGYTGTFPVAPGSIASAYGNFGNVPTTALESFSPMPRELAGIRVRVNGVDAPLYFVSSGQINFVVPLATANGSQPVEVVSAGNVINRGTVNVFEVAPGLAADTSPTRQAIIQNQNFATNSQSAPARRGEVIVIYATGCGATQPAQQDGVPPTELSQAVAPVQVYISVQEALVQFAGAHPQFPGICQINAVVPNQPYITGQAPLYVQVGGVASNLVSFWVE
jgi:uncharacterized protein (TIGR03437 family)